VRKKTLMEAGILLFVGDLSGEPGGGGRGLIHWGLQRGRQKKTVEMVPPPQSEGYLEGRWFYWGFRKICTRRLWKRPYLSIGFSLGNLEG
jgi:hypothetical protein